MPMLCVFCLSFLRPSFLEQMHSNTMALLSFSYYHSVLNLASLHALTKRNYFHLAKMIIIDVEERRKLAAVINTPIYSLWNTLMETNSLTKINDHCGVIVRRGGISDMYRTAISLLSFPVKSTELIQGFTRCCTDYHGWSVMTDETKTQ